ncbi:phosphoenolpyruvate--protein phosphotransferase [Acidaminobacter sp. JC074]|uniref:phosphoenolpyruvate--protein phosphotransferase n=1 Tax=Acidaminobacter sp. JC074 TaxID=2530199 RepID=UPI001F0E49B9|nr:phosphoenolpyruvate--protein phosphotransferase [Acidaminobacter sp. JC074]
MKLRGIGASDGIAIGKAFKYEKINLDIVRSEIEDIQGEIESFREAIDKTEASIKAIKGTVTRNIDAEHGLIFDAHLEILKDPVMTDEVISKVEDAKINASFALKETTDFYVSLFDQMEDEYLKSRAVDIKDVFFRVQCYLHGVKMNDLSGINEPVIIVCDDLTPSDTAQLDKSLILGFVTNIGSRTSHSAIMARTLEIPAVLGTGSVTEAACHGCEMILDGQDGQVIIEPNHEDIEAYEKKHLELLEVKKLLSKYKERETLTRCGHHIELAANIGSYDDIEGVLKNGAEGIGLFRTEFLYMNRDDFPSEEDQFQAYKKVLEAMDDKPVVIRTLDIGGDKHLSYMPLDEELNPFLGHRAIRLCLEKTDVFKTQLRALLRASIYGNLKIMFPMIATIGDFTNAKAVYDGVKADLKKEGILVSDEIELGIMVEIPAAALLADQFAKHVDFFSIGTNDLIQYTFAADRMNEKVSYLYQPFNPSLLRLIKMVSDAAHKENKWLGMCGEMAGDLLAGPLLVGLGLDELSMSPSSILPLRKRLTELNKSELESLGQKTLTCASSEDVLNLIKGIES